MTIQERIAAIIDEHHQADEYGYDVEECRCGDGRDGTETWAEHLALVLTTVLGLSQEWTWSWSEDLTCDGCPGYGFPVDSREEAQSEADSYMEIVTRYASDWESA